MPAPESAYKKISEATVQNKYPFIEEGIHIVRPVSWICRDTRLHGFSDFFDMEVVKSSNPDVAPGSHRSRMRILKRDGSLSEIKQRAHACFQAAGENVSVNDIDSDTLDGITGTQGAAFRKCYLKIEASQTKTKGGDPFTACIYSVPTVKDLEGLEELE